jgi:hypothetical protein
VHRGSLPRSASALRASAVGGVHRAACRARPVMLSEAACRGRERMRLAYKCMVASRAQGWQSARKPKRERVRCRKVVL